MEDWHDCNDPAELRIRLDVALKENAELHAKLAEFQAENERLRTQLGMLTAEVPQVLPQVPEPWRRPSWRAKAGCRTRTRPPGQRRRSRCSGRCSSAARTSTPSAG
ncbi:hypothetical protein ACSNOH_04850 [Streptomyces sp. URMC 127]|uniref:hypothetical protein n=1 Tax=Streptomyces sp. URMC 127 TaxID=3423402 RepID=UPI003F1C783D